MTHAHDHAAAYRVDPGTRRLLTIALVPLAALTVVALALLWPTGEDTSFSAIFGEPDERIDATVEDVEEGPCEGTPEAAGVRCATVAVRIDEGPDDGDIVVLPEQPVGGSFPELSRGDGVVLGFAPEAGPGFQYYFADLQRRFPLLVLGAVFAAAVIALGRWKGLRALFGVVLSLLVLVQFALPSLLEGSEPVAVALAASAAIAFAALYLAHGLNVRTSTALLGTLASLALTGVLAAVFIAATDLTGLSSEEAQFLQVSAGQVDLRGLLLAGVIVGTLGVLDDVTVTQVSAVWELRRANPAYGVVDLYRSAVNIGRDHIASTVNTLVLAYAGASLPLLLLFTQSGQGLGDVLTGEIVAQEVVRALVGSVGLVASVPLTTLLAALVVSRHRPVEPKPSLLR